MLFFDLDNFIKAAVAISLGHDPYVMPDIYYPLPLYLIFIPLAGLPLSVAHVIWSAIELGILVAVLRRRAVMVVLFAPVILTFLMGQIVMPMLGLFVLLQSRKFGGLALGLLVLKPQLVLFVAPWVLWQWWKNNRKQIVWFTLTIGLLFFVGFIIQSDWLSRWLLVSGHRLRAPISSSLWGLLSFLPMPAWLAVVGLATLGVVAWAWRKNDFDLITAAGFLVNPICISYDLTIMTALLRDQRAWTVITFASWVSFALSAIWLNEGAYVLTTLVVLVFLYSHRYLHHKIPTGDICG